MPDIVLWKNGENFVLRWFGGRENRGILDAMCDDRMQTPTAGVGGLNAARRDQIVQLFSRAWRRVQQRTGRSWDKKRERWRELLGSPLPTAPGAPSPAEVSSNQLRVALNNLVTFAQLPPLDARMLREAIHADYLAVRDLAVRALGEG